MMKKSQMLGWVLSSSFSFLSHAANQVTVFEDLLYWHASEQTSSPWAAIEPDPIPTSGYSYTAPNVYFGWSPGLRVGIEYKPANFFDAKLYGTYFSTKTHAEVTAPPGQFILPEFFNSLIALPETIFVTAGEVGWQLTMNMIDAEIGHQYNPLDSLAIRPFIGVKGVTINQSIHSTWQASTDHIHLFSDTENLKNNFYGVGPSFGLDSTWHLYKNINILSDVSTALLWGHWNINDTYKRPPGLVGIIPETTIVSNTKNAMLGAFTARYFMGLEWRFQAKALVTIKAGYEMQFWSNQLRLPMVQQVPLHGDLTLQGGTCGIIINL